jgi:hypothetical protein
MWIVGLLSAGGSLAHGALIYTTDRGAFVSEQTGLSVLGFEGLAPARRYIAFNGETLGGVTFVSSYAESASYYAAYYDWGSGDQIQAVGPLRATFSTPVTAVGFDFFTILPYANPVNIHLSTGDTFLLQPTHLRPNMAFAGFVSDQPIDWVEIDTSSSTRRVLMDNLRYGEAFREAVVPEPATAGLLMTAAGMVTLGRRRCRGGLPRPVVVTSIS